MLLRKQRVESGGGGMGVPKKRGLYEMQCSEGGKGKDRISEEIHTKPEVMESERERRRREERERNRGR